MPELLSFIALLIQLYIYVVFAAAILSWLVAFNMLNTRNRFIYMVGSALNRGPGFGEDWVVEPRGIEPLTSTLRTSRSPN